MGNIATPQPRVVPDSWTCIMQNMCVYGFEGKCHLCRLNNYILATLLYQCKSLSNSFLHQGSNNDALLTIMTNITTCREKRVISRRRGGKSNNITSNNDYKRIILCLEFFAHKHTSRISKLLQKNNNLINILNRDTKYSYKLKNYSICCWPTLKKL